MRRESVRIGLWHNLAGGVIDEDALDRVTPENHGDCAVTLLHEIAKHDHEECGGADVETLMKRLASHAIKVPAFEIASNLVEGCESCRQRAE
jgi:hypothetical protein